MSNPVKTIVLVTQLFQIQPMKKNLHLRLKKMN